MDEIIKQVNWDGDFNSFLNYLRTSPRFYYDNSEDLFNAYLIMSKTIDPLLTKIFKVFPRAPMVLYQSLMNLHLLQQLLITIVQVLADLDIFMQIFTNLNLGQNMKSQF